MDEVIFFCILLSALELINSPGVTHSVSCVWSWMKFGLVFFLSFGFHVQNRILLNHVFGYPLGDNHIRIGNRTRLYAVSVLDCHRSHYFPVPLFPGPTISRYFDIIGHKAAGVFHSIIKA